MNPVVIDYEKCKKDGICAVVCPRRLFELDSENKPSLHPDTETLCLNCGHCFAACPPGAITLNGLVPEKSTSVNKNIWPMFENLDHLMRSRRSVRMYKDKPVEKPTISELLDTARYAPTGSNTQAVEWIAVTERSRVVELGQLVIDWMEECVANEHPLAERLSMEGLIGAWNSDEDMIFRGAPALIINHSAESSGLPIENSTIAMTYLELAAPTKDLGTCWAGYLMIAAAFSEKIKNTLNIPDGNKLCTALMLGHAKYSYKRVPARNDISVTWW